MRENNAADDTAGTDVDAMEAIARQAPLSARRRPAWDIHVLHGLGMSVFADPEIWKQVWTENERISNASTSSANLVHAVKTASGENPEKDVRFMKRGENASFS